MRFLPYISTTRFFGETENNVCRGKGERREEKSAIFLYKGVGEGVAKMSSATLFPTDAKYAQNHIHILLNVSQRSLHDFNLKLDKSAVLLFCHSCPDTLLGLADGPHSY